MIFSVYQHCVFEMNFVILLVIFLPNISERITSISICHDLWYKNFIWTIKLLFYRIQFWSLAPIFLSWVLRDLCSLWDSNRIDGKWLSSLGSHSDLRILEDSKYHRLDGATWFEKTLPIFIMLNSNIEGSQRNQNTLQIRRKISRTKKKNRFPPSKSYNLGFILKNQQLVIN